MSKTATSPWWMRSEAEPRKYREPLSPATKETVIVVHGTYDAPRAARVGWYQPGGAFCVALDKELERLKSPARCWSHTKSGEMPFFSWDGANSFESRQSAAA